MCRRYSQNMFELCQWYVLIKLGTHYNYVYDADYTDSNIFFYLPCVLFVPYIRIANVHNAIFLYSWLILVEEKKIRGNWRSLGKMAPTSVAGTAKHFQPKLSLPSFSLIANVINLAFIQSQSNVKNVFELKHHLMLHPQPHSDFFAFIS